MFGTEWCFTRTENTNLRSSMLRRFLVFAELWSKSTFMWEPRPGPLNLHIVLWGHSYYALKTCRRMLVFPSCLGAIGVLLLPSSPCYFSPSWFHILLTLPLMSELFAIFGKRTPPHVFLKHVRIIMCSRVLIKNKHHQVSLLSIRSLDSDDAMTYLFHLLLCVLICQMCKAQESTYYFKTLQHLEDSCLFFSLPLNCSPCLSQKISKLPWNSCWNSKFAQLTAGVYLVARFHRWYPMNRPSWYWCACLVPPHCIKAGPALITEGGQKWHCGQSPPKLQKGLTTFNFTLLEVNHHVRSLTTFLRREAMEESPEGWDSKWRVAKWTKAPDIGAKKPAWIF